MYKHITYPRSGRAPALSQITIYSELALYAHPFQSIVRPSQIWTPFTRPHLLTLLYTGKLPKQLPQNFKAVPLQNQTGEWWCEHGPTLTAMVHVQ